MIFRLMLFGFGMAMKTGFAIASLKDSAFKRRIKDKKFIIQVKMNEENKGRYYQLANGKITSKGRITKESPGVLIAWKNSKTAVRTLLKTNLKGLYASITDAVVSGDLAVEVEWAETHDFIEALINMATVYSGFLPMLKKVPGAKKIFA